MFATCCKVVLLSIAVVLLTASAQSKGQDIPRPAAGYVPDEATAIRVAEAVLIPIYGQRKIEGERPLTATLKGDVWTIKGSLPKAGPGEIVMGGVATVRLSKRTGCILSVGHGK